MPIYEETYRPWEGQLEKNPRTWWVIARTGVKLFWKKWMILLLLLASIPFFVRAVQIYLMSRYGDQIRIGGEDIGRIVDGFRINPKFFFDYLNGQGFFLILVLILAGAGLIARDRKLNALPIYFSKPVGFWDYIAGKFQIVAFYGGLVTFIPALVLWLFRVLLAPDASFINTFYWIPFALLLIASLNLFALGGVVLALSSVARSMRAAAILFFAVWIFPDLLRQILAKVPEIGLLSLNADLRQISAVILGVAKPFDFSVWWALIIVLVVILLSGLALRLRVKPTEVVL